MAENISGHQTVPHTADLRVQAWAPTRDCCIKEAVLGTVESFLDTSSARRKCTRRRTLSEERDDDLLVAVLDEVIYFLDTEAEVPIDIDAQELDSSIEVCFTMADARTLPQLAAIPKAVCLNDVQLSQDGDSWRCQVTLDV